jgi:hypothetical protein
MPTQESRVHQTPAGGVRSTSLYLDDRAVLWLIEVPVDDSQAEPAREIRGRKRQPR